MSRSIRIDDYERPWLPLAVRAFNRAGAGSGVNPILDVRFDRFMADPLGTVTGVLDFAQHRPGADGWAAMRSYLDANPRGKHGAIVYDLADFGLDARELERRFGAYRERFSLPSDV